jgi:hypothetical protein
MPAETGEEFVPPTAEIISPETLPDISEAYGRTVHFHDADIRLNSADYNGETLKAEFSLLYIGSDYESYEPEYLRLHVGCTIIGGNAVYAGNEQDDFTCTFTEVPEADSFTHLCTYSAPVNLEPGRAYSVWIDYFSPNHEGTDGASTQGIEADTQKYRFVFCDGNVFEFDRCRVIPTSYTFDGLTLDMRYQIFFKDGQISESIGSGIYDPGFKITTGKDCIQKPEIFVAEDECAYMHTRITLLKLAQTCDATFFCGDRSYTLHASLPQASSHISFDFDVQDDSAAYHGHADVTASAASLVLYDNAGQTAYVPEVLSIIMDNGTTLTGEYTTQLPYNETNTLLFIHGVCDPEHIKSIFYGSSCIYESRTTELASDKLQSDDDQWMEFPDENGSIKVHFRDHYFDKTTLKLHYDVVFPRAVPDNAADRIQTYLTESEGWSGYLHSDTKVLAQTADTISLERVFTFFSPTDIVNVSFFDTGAVGSSAVKFRLKSGIDAEIQSVSCPEPYEYKVNIGGKDTAELSQIRLCPSAVTAVFRSNGVNDEDTFAFLGSSDIRVMRRYGGTVELGESTVQIRDDTFTILAPLEEVTALLHIEAVFINDRLVWDRNSPEGGIVGTTINNG